MIIFFTIIICKMAFNLVLKQILYTYCCLYYWYMSSLFLYKKNLEEYRQKFKYNKHAFNKKKRFLICESCFWMVSTLPDASYRYAAHYAKCPVCADKLFEFLISI